MEEYKNLLYEQVRDKERPVEVRIDRIYGDGRVELSFTDEIIFPQNME